jgi:hypothetical protein
LDFIIYGSEKVPIHQSLVVDGVGVAPTIYEAFKTLHPIVVKGDPAIGHGRAFALSVERLKKHLVVLVRTPIHKTALQQLGLKSILLLSKLLLSLLNGVH